MSKVDLQTPKYNVIDDATSAKVNHQAPDSVLNSNERVTQEELKQISMFSSDSTTVETALGIGAVAAGSVALAYGAKRFGLLNKLFPVVEDAGLQYRKVLGKKVGLKLSSTPYEKVVIPNNNLMSKRVKNPHPTNLRNELERCNYSYYELTSLLIENPNLSRTVGSLPSSWAKNFKSAEVRQRVDEILSKYASEFHAVKEGSFPSISSVQKELSEILGTNVVIKDLGGGKVGYAYKISAFGEECVFKTYYHKPLVNVESSGHGNHAELLGALKAKKKNPKQFATFYMGKFGYDDDGYMLTKFIPETENAARKSTQNNLHFSSWYRRVKSGDDHKANIRNGITLDYGATLLTTFDKLSPNAQKIIRELTPMLRGKSPEKVAEAVKKYSGTKELEEAKQFIQYQMENHYIYAPQCMMAREANFAQLGMYARPDIRNLINNGCSLEPYIKNYGITKNQAFKLHEEYFQRNLPSGF